MTLTNLLWSAWAREPPLLTAQDMLNLGDAERAALLKSSFVRRDRPATSASCPDCGDVFPVDRISTSVGPALYVTCYKCGPSRVEPQRLEVWRIDCQLVAKTVGGLLRFKTPPTELQPRQLWCLGRLYLKSARPMLYLLRSAKALSDQFVKQVTQVGKPILTLVTSEREAASLPVPCQLLALTVIWDGNALGLSSDWLQNANECFPSVRKKVNPPPRRATVLSDIEKMTKELRSQFAARKATLC